MMTVILENFDHLLTLYEMTISSKFKYSWYALIIPLNHCRKFFQFLTHNNDSVSVFTNLKLNLIPERVYSFCSTIH